MKIISQFKDYYDHGMAFGQDPAIVYARKFEENRIYSTKAYSFSPELSSWLRSTKMEKLIRNMRSFYVAYAHGKGSRFSLTTGYLVVAGKLHPIVKLNQGVFGETTALLYTLEEVDAYLQENAKDASMGAHLRDYLAKFFEFKVILDYNGSYEEIDPMHMLEDCLSCNLPVLLFYGSVGLAGFSEFWVLKDVSLKEMGFFSVMNSSEVYQEIEMFLGLVKTRQPLPSADNNNKITGHGFDLKESFRHRK